MGRLNLSSPTSPVSWRLVASTSDAGGGAIADHWHVYANGFHWISFSANNARDAYLLKLDRDFNRVALFTVVRGSQQPTNDHFLVAEPDGVAVAVFLPGVGHLVYRFDTQGTPRGTVQIGGGSAMHGNGSSAIPIQVGFHVLATESLTPMATSRIRLLSYDSSWRLTGNSTLISQDRTNYGMASGVLLESGYMVVNLRVRENVNPRGVHTPPTGGDDSGGIVQIIVAPDGQVASQRTIVASGGNRPHTALKSDLLITTWDGGNQVFLRVDRIS